VTTARSTYSARAGVGRERGRGVAAHPLRAVRAWGLLLFAAAALSACTPRYRVTEAVDRFAGTRRVEMRGNDLSSTRAEEDWMALDLQALCAGDSARYTFRVDYRALAEPLEIRTGESLLLLVDGARVALARTDRAPRWTQGARRTETALYAAPADVVRAVRDASDVRVRVLGRRYYADRAFSEENRRRIRRVAGACVQGGTASDTADARP
jgi:hypothetical protein